MLKICSSSNCRYSMVFVHCTIYPLCINGGISRVNEYIYIYIYIYICIYIYIYIYIACDVRRIIYFVLIIRCYFSYFI